MIERFFLALDYAADNDIVGYGMRALEFLENEFGRDFVEKSMGVKINEDALIGAIDQRFRKFKNDKGCSIFADLKIKHGYGTGGRTMKRLSNNLPADYVTVSADLGTGILKRYVEAANSLKMAVIAFTVHTKISEVEAERMYKQPVSDAIYNFARMASEAGCDSVVLEAGMLRDERIRALPVKKLVTGIRIDPSDKGTQQRVSTVEELAELLPHVSYAVISSRYIGKVGEPTVDFNKLKEIINLLR